MRDAAPNDQSQAFDPFAPDWRPADSDDSDGPPLPMSHAFARLLVRVPQPVRRTFSYRQLAALARACPAEPARTATPSDGARYTFHVPWVSGTYYVTIYAGRERRARENSGNGLWRQLKLACSAHTALIVVVAALVAIASGVVLYMAKSLLGIDLFEGPSPLHALFATAMH